MVKCQICGLFEGDRECLGCDRKVCSADTCVVAYAMGQGSHTDKVVCINCG